MTVQKGFAWDGKGQPPRVEVHWQDAATHSGWSFVEDALVLGLAENTTAGYLLRWDDTVVRLAGTFAAEKGEIKEFSDVTVIPAGWVTKVKSRGRTPKRVKAVGERLAVPNA